MIYHDLPIRHGDSPVMLNNQRVNPILFHCKSNLISFCTHRLCDALTFHFFDACEQDGRSVSRLPEELGRNKIPGRMEIFWTKKGRITRSLLAGWAEEYVQNVVGDDHPWTSLEYSYTQEDKTVYNFLL